MTTRVAIQCDSGISPECLGFSEVMPTALVTARKAGDRVSRV
jgi:hypothetical protein